MTKILVTGSDGQIGQEIQQLSKLDQNRDFEFHFFNKMTWDITNNLQSQKYFEQLKPDILINTAAYTLVDLAEKNKEICFDINTEAPTYLAHLCKNFKVKFIHFSSDYVFNNPSIKTPILEDDLKFPKGIYALSKSLAEDKILEINSDAIIIRSSWIYSNFGSNFVKTMLRLGKVKDELKIVDDQIGSPTYAFDIATTVLFIIKKIISSNQNIQGIFHYANEGSVSWFGFANEIFNQANIQLKLIPIDTSDYNAAAPRPSYSVLNCQKIKTTFGIEIPFWKDSLSTCLSKLS